VAFGEVRIAGSRIITTRKGKRASHTRWSIACANKLLHHVYAILSKSEPIKA
jgi:hypothetical protein